MAKQLIQDKRKLPQSFVLCIFLHSLLFFKSYKFPENNPLSLVYSPISHGWKSRGYASVNLLKHYILKKGMEKIWGIRGSIIPLELWMRRDQSYLKKRINLDILIDVRDPFRWRFKIFFYCICICTCLFYFYIIVILHNNTLSGSFYTIAIFLFYLLFHEWVNRLFSSFFIELLACFRNITTISFVYPFFVFFFFSNSFSKDNIHSR